MSGTPRQVRPASADRRNRSKVSYAVAAAAALGVAVCALPASATAAQTEPSVPGCDGRGRIAFVADRGDGAGVEVYTVGADGRRLTRLTDLSGEAIAPDWSPDGHSIVFEEDLADEALGRIQVMDADGRRQHVLLQEPGHYDGSPAYTPDGSHILYVRVDAATGVDAVWRMTTDGRHRTRLTPDVTTAVTAPRLSPDGHTLSYLTADATDEGLGLVTTRLGTRHTRVVVPVSADLVDKQDWSTDGRRIASSAGHDHLSPGVSENLFTVPARGGRLTYLTTTPVARPTPSWGPTHPTDAHWPSGWRRTAATASTRCRRPAAGRSRLCRCPTSSLATSTGAPDRRVDDDHGAALRRVSPLSTGEECPSGDPAGGARRCPAHHGAHDPGDNGHGRSAGQTRSHAAGPR